MAGLRPSAAQGRRGRIVNPRPARSQLIGQIGIPGTAAAVVDAVHHATGVRVRTLPVTLDEVLPRLE